MTYEEALKKLCDDPEKEDVETQKAYRKIERLVNWQKKVAYIGNRLITEQERRKMWALNSALKYACECLASRLMCVDYRFEKNELLCESHILADAETLEFFIRRKFEIEEHDEDIIASSGVGFIKKQNR